MYVICLLGFLLSVVELTPEPAWESNDNDYSTGGILADINSDGELDLVTGNGNDMARNPNKTYYNEGDMLEKTASWSSEDWRCSGHISLGDVDRDGDLDLAAAGFAYHIGWVSDPTSVYTNEEGTFSGNPVWSGGDTLHAFSCDWGDADTDGDLDLALAPGNDYNNRRQKLVIYGNIEGILSAETVWESADSDYNMDVCWVDVDGDGDLDLAAGGYETNRIYFTENGSLDTEAGWISADSHNTVQIAFADFDFDGDMDMATADNNQFGDEESRIRIYLNNDGELEPFPFWESKLWRYQSCVAWGDVDSDGDLDLAAGGWWEPLSVYENKDGSFDANPDWTGDPGAGTSLVCEQIIWGEVDNDHWAETTDDFGAVSAGNAIYPTHFPALDIVDVTIAGIQATPEEFLWNPADGWIQINKTGNVQVTYRYSTHPDLLVTNWDPPNGNFLFLNEAADITEQPSEIRIPVVLAKTLYASGEKIKLSLAEGFHLKKAIIYDVTGRRLMEFASPDATSSCEFTLDTSRLGSGVYILRLITNKGPHTFKVQVL